MSEGFVFWQVMVVACERTFCAGDECCASKDAAECSLKNKKPRISPGPFGVWNSLKTVNTICQDPFAAPPAEAKSG
jgi:hypothetical protein